MPELPTTIMSARQAFVKTSWIRLASDPFTNRNPICAFRPQLAPSDCTCPGYRISPTRTVPEPSTMITSQKFPVMRFSEISFLYFSDPPAFPFAASSSTPFSSYFA